MEQALAGSALANASPAQRALRLSSDTLTAQQLVADLPATLDQYVEAPVTSASVPVSVPLPDGQSSVATRLFAAADACRRLEVTEGDCPTRAGQVMVSADDVATNGWTVGSQVDGHRAGRPALRRGRAAARPGDHRGRLRAGPGRRLARRADHGPGRSRDPGRRRRHRRLGDRRRDDPRRRGHASGTAPRARSPGPSGHVDHDELLRIGPVDRRLPRRRALRQCGRRRCASRPTSRRSPSDVADGQRPGPDHRGGPRGPAARAGGRGALDGPRRRHRRPASRARAGAAARSRPARRRGVPPRGAGPGHPGWASRSGCSSRPSS